MENEIDQVRRRPLPVRTVPTRACRDGSRSGRALNTIAANDVTFYEQLNARVQQGPATPSIPRPWVQLAAIGIVKAKPFQPDVRAQARSNWLADGSARRVSIDDFAAQFAAGLARDTGLRKSRLTIE